MIFSLDFSNNTYNFEIVYNSTDIIVQVELDEKLYQDVFLLTDLEKQNNIFKNIKIVERFLTKALTKKPTNGYSYKIFLNKKVLVIECVYSNDLEDIKLSLELLPIRKDISCNKEIIDLKKKVKLLENKLSNYNLFFDKIYINPNINKYIQKDTKYIVFSNINTDFLYSIHRFEGYTGHNALYNHLGVNPYSGHSATNLHIILNNHIPLGDNYLDEEFLETFTGRNLEVLVFVNQTITENILMYIPYVKYLNFVKCNMKDFTGISKVDNINLYDCEINNIDNFKNYKHTLTINSNKNPAIFNQAILPSNVKFNCHTSINFRFSL
jgi:hypothetical protein